VPRYAALLRGVMPFNCKMADLKKALEKGGLTDVQTVIASGNVVFSTRAASEETIAKKCEAAMQKHMGRSFMTIVRPIERLEEILGTDPFGKLPPNAKRNVTFLADAPKAKPALPVDLKGARIVSLVGREAYTYYIPGVADPSFMTSLEKTFGKDITTRTWDTVGRIVKAGASA
jgi:uncharacterized protein (DUF1697 family)